MYDKSICMQSEQMVADLEVGGDAAEGVTHASRTGGATILGAIEGVADALGAIALEYIFSLNLNRTPAQYGVTETHELAR